MKTKVMDRVGFLGESSSGRDAVFCERVTGKSKNGKEYDNIQIQWIYRAGEAWKKNTRRLSTTELKIKKTFRSCQISIELLPEAIRALNDLYKEITGETVVEADVTVEEEFDVTGEMMANLGLTKDRGR